MTFNKAKIWQKRCDVGVYLSLTSLLFGTLFFVLSALTAMILCISNKILLITEQEIDSIILVIAGLWLISSLIGIIGFECLDLYSLSVICNNEYENCPNCSYSLDGLTTKICPECNEKINWETYD